MALPGQRERGLSCGMGWEWGGMFTILQRQNPLSGGTPTQAGPGCFPAPSLPCGASPRAMLPLSLPFFAQDFVFPVPYPGAGRPQGCLDFRELRDSVGWGHFSSWGHDQVSCFSVSIFGFLPSPTVPNPRSRWIPWEPFPDTARGAPCTLNELKSKETL